MKKVTTSDILQKKKAKQKITALSTYDFAFAKLVDQSGADIVLVGDSVGMVQLGYESTLPVTLDEMIHHTKAVSRAVKRALVVADMPYKTYETAVSAIKSARRFIEDSKADAVKLEGGEKVIKQVKALTRLGISVMGHLGMLPQSVDKTGGYKVQGKDKKQAEQILKDAKALEEAGAFSIVLECIPYELARKITESIKIPTIGIGAGPYCDGQILVLHDLLGFKSSVSPRFVRRYMDFDTLANKALEEFRRDVETQKFPSLKESFE